MITVNGILVNYGRENYDGAFPSGEPKLVQCWAPDEEQNLVKFRYENDAEMYYVFCIGVQLRQTCPQATNILYMEYIPNARCDKPFGRDGDLMHANAINAALFNPWFDKIYGVEPHSDDFRKQYKNAVPIYPTATALVDVRRYLESNRNIQWVFPDKGAFTRYQGQLPGVTEDDIIIIGKHRTNGVIDKTEIESGAPRSGYDLVIVDDLCSKGGTFYGAGEKLRAAGADGDIYLVISHLEPTVFRGKLLGVDSPIERIFVCTKSLGELPHPKIVYLNTDYQKEVE
ncbi:MAG: hypothetical protein LBC95_00535 [Candidatus Nomurabacteria bacterium]|jgi:ribose-phosphate pyrophosphokinase|nr:hypothetical protein [Candidatus Nomurabacteria bacterium]